jgi:hypothetical protein
MAFVITDKGLEILAKRIKGLGTEPVYIGWGTGVGTAAITDTILFTEDTTGGYTRAIGVSAIVTVGVANDTWQVSGALTALAALSITNWGLFDAAVGGNLLVHEDSAIPYTLAAGAMLNFIFKLQEARCL